jgi:hypothetical protein
MRNRFILIASHDLLAVVLLAWHSSLGFVVKRTKSQLSLRLWVPLATLVELTSILHLFLHTASHTNIYYKYDYELLLFFNDIAYPGITILHQAYPLRKNTLSMVLFVILA